MEKKKNANILSIYLKSKMDTSKITELIKKFSNYFEQRYDNETLTRHLRLSETSYKELLDAIASEKTHLLPDSIIQKVSEFVQREEDSKARVKELCLVLRKQEDK